MKLHFRSIVLSILTSTLFGIASVFGQPGNIDLTFNPNDVGFGYGDGANFQIRASAILSDGKILIAGEFITYNGVSRPRIARLNADGTVDHSFNPENGADDIINALAVQADGKIVIGGLFTTYNGTTQNRIARLNTDGSLDNTFSIGNGANGTVHSISIQSDGKIFIAGEFTSYNGTSRSRVARLNSDGTLDTNFAPASTNNMARAIAVQTDGKVIIAGEFTIHASVTRNRIIRLNADGSFDNTFVIGTGLNGTVFTCSLQSDGKVIVGGSFTSYNGISRNRIIRLNTDGSLDNSFSIGTGFSNSGVSVVCSKIQADNKILLGGNFTTYNGVPRSGLLRLNTDGTLDETFDVGTGTNNTVRTLSIQSDNKIIIAGTFVEYNGVPSKNVARLNINASHDESFNAGSGANNVVYASAVLPDGKILIAGLFDRYNGVPTKQIVRINPDGSIDNSFNANVSGTIYTISVQSDGKVIIGGQFTIIDGVTRNRIARLNTNGSLDTSFNPGTGASNTVWSSVIQPDGKVIIGGIFTTVNSTQRNRVARLNTDGSLDPTFLSAAISSNTGANNDVYCVALQADGQVLIGGAFTNFNNAARARIARLNSNGTLDTSFTPGTGFGHAVRALAIQNDGKIVAGGQFVTFNAIGRIRLARVNSDGTLDTSFIPGEGINNTIFALALDANQKILIGGQFTTFQEISSNSIARINSDGTVDVSFDTGTGANAEIRTINLDQNGDIIIGGAFTGYNETGRNRVARVSGSCAPITSTDNIVSSTPITWIDGNTYTESNNTATYTIVGGASNGCDSIVTLNLTIVEPLPYTLSATDNQICAGSEVTLSITFAPSYPAGYVHCNPSNPTQVIDVTNPTTGKIWMDRNLGANRAAISSTDAESYGSLFQWGRFADGHQCVHRYDGDGVTTSGTTTTISTSATPSNGNFIVTNNAHWQTPVLNNLWSGANGTNNPCPVGYRLPTQAEMNAERLSWQQAPINGGNNISGGFASPLKFTMAGRRNNSNAALTSVGAYGSYWTSTAQAFEETSFDLFINSTNATVGWNHNRSTGVSVRCIKD